MRCKELRSISRYFDNELSLRDKEFIEAHIKTCSYCRLEVERFEELRKVISLNKVSFEPDLFWQSLKLRIDNAVVEGVEGIYSEINNWSKRLIFLPVMAALLFVIIFNLGVREKNLVDEYIFGINLNKSSILFLGGTNKGLDALLY